LSRKKQKALKELTQNTEINIKKADKVSTTVVMEKNDKTREGKTQIDNHNNYRPLTKPMVWETHSKALRLMTEMHHGNHIDDMTKEGLIQTLNPPRTSQFYTLTKILKPIITGRPIISRCDGPTEKISSLVDTLLLF